MSRKFISAFLILALVSSGTAGCGIDIARGLFREYQDNKDTIKEEFNELKDSAEEELSDWIGSVSGDSLTADKDLKGERKLGVDDYVGTYQAEYDKFDGEEFIFGGTSMKRSDGVNLDATYSLDIRSGRAKLYWLGSSDEHIVFGERQKHVIAEATSSDNCEFTLKAGENFLVLKGENFTGKLSLEVK